MTDLSGGTAVITGAGSGIGRALAVAFAQEGMSIVGADLHRAALLETGALIKSSGGVFVETVTDVSDPASVQALAATALDHFGPVRVVCSNAGFMRPGVVWEQPAEIWERVLGVNVLGSVHMANSFMPGMVSHGQPGRFVTTVGVTGLFTAPFSPPGSYSVSKHALLAFSEILHHELRAIGAPIGVTVLCPSGVRSEIKGDPNAADGPTIRQPEAWARVEALYEFIRTGLEPAEVARQTVEAVKEDRFWVFPHPEHVARAQHRADYIVGALEPTPPTLGARSPSR